jgi:hypothetical protein
MGAKVSVSEGVCGPAELEENITKALGKWMKFGADTNFFRSNP